MTRAAVVATVVALATSLVGCGGGEEVFAVPEATDGEVVKLDSAQGSTLVDSDEKVVVVDVRTTEEYVDGHLVGAQNINVDDAERWEQRVAALDPDRTTLVYSRTGSGSAEAAQLLVDAGFTSVYDLGGVEDWDSDQLRVER